MVLYSFRGISFLVLPSMRPYVLFADKRGSRSESGCGFRSFSVGVVFLFGLVVLLGLHGA